jgi:hypothetical protein
MQPPAYSVLLNSKGQPLVDLKPMPSKFVFPPAVLAPTGYPQQNNTGLLSPSSILHTQGIISPSPTPVVSFPQQPPPPPQIITQQNPNPVLTIFSKSSPVIYSQNTPPQHIAEVTIPNTTTLSAAPVIPTMRPAPPSISSVANTTGFTGQTPQHGERGGRIHNNDLKWQKYQPIINNQIQSVKPLNLPPLLTTPPQSNSMKTKK